MSRLGRAWPNMDWLDKLAVLACLVGVTASILIMVIFWGPTDLNSPATAEPNTITRSVEIEPPLRIGVDGLPFGWGVVKNTISGKYRWNDDTGYVNFADHDTYQEAVTDAIDYIEYVNRENNSKWVEVRE